MHQARYTFGGDEHIYVEMDEEMSLDAFFKSLSMSNAVRDANIPGVTEICPANASFQVKFDPDVTRPTRCSSAVESRERGQGRVRKNVDPDHRDPGFLQRSLDARDADAVSRAPPGPAGTDLEYAARINGYDSVEAFIEAHSGAPWFVSMVGFVAGLPFLYQMVERGRADRRCPSICGRAPTRPS